MQYPTALEIPPARTQPLRAATADGALTQSVQRALSILALFTDEQPAQRVSDVQRALGLGQSTASRLLGTLEALDYVWKDAATGQYRLGPEVIRLGGVALNDSELRRQALPELHEASIRLGLGANLATLRRYTSMNGEHGAGGESWGVFYLAHFDGERAPRPYTLIGRRNALHATGIGKVLLANLPEDERARILATLPLPAYTPNTISDITSLRAALAGVRRCGYATEEEELAFGRACIAAPVRDRTGAVVAAMSLSGPLSAIRLHEREAELAQAIVELADRVSTRLGYVTAPVATPMGG